MFALGLLLSACGPEDNCNAKTTPAETTEASTQTAEDIPASTDPTTAASRGLVFVSSGNGTCTLAGIGTCIDTCLIIPDKSELGERVTKISAGAFSGNTQITAVQIPAGVVEIGAGAFSGCTNLAYISVADGNAAYKDYAGVLYSADGTRLICVPAASSLVSLTITKKVTDIADNALANCRNLKKVFYEGSEEDWKKVDIGTGNNILSSVELTCMVQGGIHCRGSAPEPPLKTLFKRVLRIPKNFLLLVNKAAREPISRAFAAVFFLWRSLFC